MKDELLRILNLKLEHLDDNILELNSLNDKLNEQEEILSYITNIFQVFNENGVCNVYNFEKLSRNDFDKSLDLIDDSIASKFNVNGCNYDGLIYLISGINKGISLTLNDEQSNAIKDFVNGLNRRIETCNESILELNNVKNKLEIKEVDTLKDYHAKYSHIIDKFNKNQYVSETSEIMDAINANDLGNDKIIELLGYLLKYNVDIYLKDKPKQETAYQEEIEIDDDSKFDLKKPFKVEKEESDDYKTDDSKDISLKDIEFSIPRFSKIDNDLSTPIVIKGLSKDEEREDDDSSDLPNDIYNDDNNQLENDFKDLAVADEQELENDDIDLSDSNLSRNNIEMDNVNTINDSDADIQDIAVPVNNDSNENIDFNEVDDDFKDLAIDMEQDDSEQKNDASVSTFDSIPDQASDVQYEEYNPFIINENNDNVQIEDNIETPEEETQVEESVEIPEEESQVEESVEIPEEEAQIEESVETPEEEGQVEESVETPEEKAQIEGNSNEEVPQNNDISDVLVRETLTSFGVSNSHINNDEELLRGDINSYKEILNTLKEKNVLNIFVNNYDLFRNTMLHSSSDIINNVFELIKDNLVSGENENYILSTCVKTLPTIFFNEPYGNYETFVANVDSFKQWHLNLIKVFAFSREMFVVDHNLMVNNYNIVQKYNLSIDATNAKYLLVVPHINEKLDYYIEAVARDNMDGGTNKTFDGIDYLKLYPNKLNMVNDIVIKRLRYSSETGKKLFGAKEKSLTGEIVNLKVDILSIPDNYLEKFVDNNFDYLNENEIASYIELVRNSNDIDLSLDDTLRRLEKYHNGLRYVIKGVNISYNKVLRIYNILIKNNISRDKALTFAVCYNSVITKDEYNEVKKVLSNLGGK